jgi:hypothetical protein
MSQIYSTGSLTPADFSAGIAAQVSVLRNETVRFIALNDAYANVVEGGTTPNHMGEQIQTLVTNRLVTGQSLVSPVFTPTVSVDGQNGPKAQFGQTLFTTQLATLRGEGPTIALNQSRFSVIDSYRIAEQNLKDAIKSVNAADIRSQLLNLSGVKATMLSTANSLDQMLTGGYNQVGVNFKGFLPDCSPSHPFLVALSNYMRDNLSPEFFGDGAGQHFVVIGSSEIVETLRNQAGVQGDLRALITGNEMAAQGAYKKYSFIDYPYRGLKLAIDQQPLRFDVLNGSGNPIPIEPLIPTVTDYGVQNLTNPDWIDADYEVAFLISKGTFRRLVPERFVGEGTMKFDPQFVMGELRWHYIEDNLNQWGDFGWHLYQIQRAFQARRPHGVIPIIYRRQPQNFGLVQTGTLNSLSLTI